MWFATGLFAQNWVEGMFDPNENFYTTQAEFEKYWADKEIEKGKGWKQFKRWEAFMEPRVAPDGVKPDPAALGNVIFSAQNSNLPNFGDFTVKGPLNGNQLEGIGRINCVAFHPQHPDTVYVGAPSGGFWRSYDEGATWETTSDDLVNIGVSAIAIHPTNPDIIYIGTGDRDAGDTYTFGVLKSVDGGDTWNTTGLSLNVTQTTRIGALVINENDPNIVVAATRFGIQRTTDGGATWTSTQGGGFHSVKANPRNPDVLYAATSTGVAKVYKSTDAGASWFQLTSGLPTSGVRRAEIGITRHDTSFVYVLYGANNNGYYGIYRSIDGGATFTQRSNSPNLLGWSTTGNDSGGQAWYDLAIAVSPTNKHEVYVGGVNVWKSTTGGTGWSLAGHWFGGGGAGFIHADQHWFEYQPGSNDLWVGNDGGIYRTLNNGVSWDSRNDGINITQYYKIGISNNNDYKIIAGAQDNGTHLDNTVFWDRVRGGDGMDCAIDPTNNNVMYASVYYGNFTKSTNGGASFNAAFNLPPSGSGNWVTPFLIDPNDANTLYAGFDRLWKSTNGGSAFAATSNSITGQNIDVVSVAKGNSNYVYVGINETVYKSTNGGASWTAITGSISNSNDVTDIEISPTNPNHIFITKSGYSNGNKVYESTNGGSSWSNITSNLPNLPANTIIYQEGTFDGVYVGTDVGIYFKDGNSNQWVRFSKNLPNVIVTDLEINYNTNELVAGTYGRGVYASPLITELIDQPIADFYANPSGTCSIGDTITLFDLSQNIPTQWNWTITPSTFTYVNGTGPNDYNPEIVFTAPGNYSIQLTVANTQGSDSKTKANVLGVGGFALPFIEDFEDTTRFYSWTVDNPDGAEAWYLNQNALNAGMNNAAALDFFAMGSSASSDELTSPAINLSNHTGVTMTFDFAYKGIGGSTDTLNVWVSDDCGANWYLEATYAGSTLRTGPDQTTSFVPTGASDWCGQVNYASCASVDLSAYANETILVRFEGVHNQGNNLYIDNINISGTPTTAPIVNFISDTSACVGNGIQFYDASSLSPTGWEWTFTGGTPATSTAQNPMITYTTAGTYAVELKVTNAAGADSIVKTSYIQVNPDVTPTVSIASNVGTNVCEFNPVTLTATTTNEGVAPMYRWLINGAVAAQGSATVTFFQLQSGDQVELVLFSSEECSTLDSVVSNTLTFTVNPLPSVSFGSVGGICVSSTPVTLTQGSPVGGTYSGAGVSGSTFDPSVTGAGTHTIWYSFTNASGCKDSASTTVFVDVPPTVFLTGPGELCEDQGSITLGGGFPFGGDYTVDGNPETSFDPSTAGAGTYVLGYEYNNGNCSGFAYDTITVVPALPNPTVTVQWGILTCDQVGVAYQWLDGSGTPIPGETNQVFYPTAAGNYRVRITTLNDGCDKTSGNYFIGNIGVNEFESSIRFNLFPNPTAGEFRVQFELAQSEEAEVEIVNAIGQVIFKSDYELNPGLNTLSINPKAAAGIYFLRFKIGEDQLVRKFRVE
ncbi:MAG: hypothetical protein SchgKO_03130 [Schleiferiaceae bacterium]